MTTKEKKENRGNFDDDGKEQLRKHEKLRK